MQVQVIGTGKMLFCIVLSVQECHHNLDTNHDDHMRHHIALHMEAFHSSSEQGPVHIHQFMVAELADSALRCHGSGDR